MVCGIEILAASEEKTDASCEKCKGSIVSDHITTISCANCKESYYHAYCADQNKKCIICGTEFFAVMKSYSSRGTKALAKRITHPASLTEKVRNAWTQHFQEINNGAKEGMLIQLGAGGYDFGKNGVSFLGISAGFSQQVGRFVGAAGAGTTAALACIAYSFFSSTDPLFLQALEVYGTGFLGLNVLGYVLGRYKRQ